MLNKPLIKQTLVATLLAAPMSLADPPAARWPVRAFDDWRLDCTASPCTLRTAILGADGNAVLRLALLPGEPPLLALATPLPVYVPDGLVLAAGDEPPIAIPWRICGPDGCTAQVAATPALLAALRRERAASATLTPSDGVPVRIRVSLIGYTAASRAAGGQSLIRRP